jgi:asparagine synthase (glutamine-hydrolysing)
MTDNKIGDLLITFKKGDHQFPVRNHRSWETMAEIDGATIYTTQPDEIWQGFPVQEYADGCWRIWLLGELTEPEVDLRKSITTPESLNGNFLIIGYDKVSKQWHVVTNRLGTLHIYKGIDGQRNTIGTFSPSVTAATDSSHLNWSALASFFTFGFFPGNQTFWDNIQILGPARHLVLNRTGERVSENNYWQWDYRPNLNRSFVQALDEFSQIFEVVINQMVENKSVALPISGGLDSRCTVAVLKSKNTPTSSNLLPFSYGYTDNSVETQIAKQIANTRHLPIRTWTIHPYLFDQLSRVLFCLEGYQDLTQTRQAYVIDDLSKDTSYILAAHWGDVWLDDMGFTNYIDTPSDEELSAILTTKYTKRGSELLLTLFRDHIPSTISSQLQANTRDELKKYSTINDLDFKVKLWKTQTWSFRWTLASLRMYQAGLFPLLPFYDNRMVDFFLTLPSTFVKQRSFQIEYLKRFAPDLAKIRWQPFDANLYEYKNFNTWLLPRRIYKKIRRSLSGKPTVQRNWEIQLLKNSSPKKLKKWLCTPGLKLQNYTEKRGLEQAVETFLKKPDRANGYEMSMLLTLSAWLENYG